jgi:hypothetical protein
VKVYVKHRLMRSRSVVLQDVVGVRTAGRHHGPSDAREHPTDRRRGVVVQLVQMGDALLGDHQRVARRERSDVEERERVLVLVDTMARDPTVENLVEDRLAHADVTLAKRVYGPPRLTSSDANATLPPP